MKTWLDPSLAERLQSEEECYVQYTPALCFRLLDPAQRLFGAKRMRYLGSIDGWQTEPIATLACALISTLGTDQFYNL